MGPRGRGTLLVFAVTLAFAAACGEGDPAPAPAPASADAGAEAEAPAALCVDGKPTAAWPPGPYRFGANAVLPPHLSFLGADERISLDSLFEPCAPRSRIVVVRYTAPWCGTCEWHLDHDLAVWQDPRLSDRLILVDLVVSDRDNMSPPPAVAREVRARIGGPPGALVGLDPQFVFAPARLSRAPLPAYFFVDTRTMKILSTAADPDLVTLADKLALELALLDGAPRPDPSSVPVHDELFNDEQWDMIQAMRLGDGAPPPDPTNGWADHPGAAALGKALFSDPSLTPSGTVSCATCHDATKDFTDGAAQSIGLVRIDRNAPSVALAAHARWQFWDGRADTLWMQALAPFEDAREMGSSRAFVAARIKASYAAEYEAVFGAKFPLATTDDARIFVNAGKSIAAFERTLRVAPNALDAYAGGDLGALTRVQKEALQAFFEVGCAQCHWGPRLTDDAFHALRFPTGRQDGQPDPGRSAQIGKADAEAPEFWGGSYFTDGPPPFRPWWTARSENMLGAFKTPTLRGVPKTAPYGHGGSLKTLREVTKNYGERGVPHDDARAAGTTEQWVPEFDVTVQELLPALLETLTADVIVP